MTTPNPQPLTAEQWLKQNLLMGPTERQPDPYLQQISARWTTLLQQYGDYRVAQALATSPQSPWRPWNTLPKAGDLVSYKFDVYAKRYNNHLKKWVYKRFIDCGYDVEPVYGYYDSYKLSYTLTGIPTDWEPTYWMERPAPPTTAQEGQA